MFRTHLLLASRNLLKRKGYSFINITGLAIGIAACLVIWRYVEFESSYENFFANKENIYRVTSSLYTTGAVESYDGYDLGPALKSEIPGIKSFARIHLNEAVLTYRSSQGQEIKFEEKNMFYADPSLLSIFSFKTLAGNASSALGDPTYIVITKKSLTNTFIMLIRSARR